MMKKNKKRELKIEDISSETDQLSHVDLEDLMPMPEPLDDPAKEPAWRPLSKEAKEKYECSLDDTLVLEVPHPASKEEEQELVRKFLRGVEKLFTK